MEIYDNESQSQDEEVLLDQELDSYFGRRHVLMYTPHGGVRLSPQPDTTMRGIH